MKTVFLIFSIIYLSLHNSHIQSFNQLTNNILNTYVQDGSVDYKTLHQNLNIFDTPIKEMQAVRLKNLSEDETKAFLLNAYNLLVIKTIAEHYPITSPLEIKGFFDEKIFWINNRRNTLDELEHKLFYLYKDPLIHFGLVCAAKGCPLLNNRIFTSDNVNKELADKTTEMLDDPSFLIEDKTNNRLKLSFIFKWNPDHFPKDLIQFINQYKTIKVSEYAGIEYYNYDWKLNER